MDSSLSTAQSPGRGQLQKHERERRIIAAARRLFDRKGYDATAMEEIAARAGLAVGTLYNYFPSKDELLLTILRRETDALIGAGEKVLQNPPTSFADAVLAIASLFVDSITSDERGLWREVLGAAMSSPQKMRTRLFELDLRFIARFASLVERFKSQNAVASDVDAIQAAGLFYSVCVAWGMAYLTNDETTVAELRDLIDGGIRLAIGGMTPRRISKESKR
jgi:AcrR family transcriptional regulator